ncbi:MULTISPECIES: filamentous hemagglutinin N-terminal domain-containing protein [Oxalobacteraceae]|uniref:two-partner secretion domain-containing protein n=1 Tax=Herminiimonas sp. Marseille-P9896 TaxID=2742211 RepID=UPI0020CA28FF|nr:MULTISPECIES: filamentous hemagglutinin N-terminal domain-containing protein [Oxalobacteraceae]
MMKKSMNMALNKPSTLAWSVRCAFLPPLLAACLGVTGIGSAVANPSNPTVVNGQVTFSQQGNVFTITNSPNAIINWSSFSIGAGEMVRFIQQNSSSAVLNRITGQDPTRIMGALQSNGRVFLINPNGIMFGAGSQVNVAGLVASTLAISNSDFLAGKNKFTAGDVTGAVSNLGAITTPSGGQVYLIAPDVSNSGIITSPKGDVVLAAGRSVQLADSTNPDMQVVVSAPTDRALNLGDVIAQGGKIGIYGALINQRGKLNANSAVVGENGKIILKASGTTLLEAGSVTSATGEGKGGEVQVLGEKVGLMGDALVDVSGQTGGGTALIGGDYQGKNAAVMNAEQTFVGKDAVIKADAITSGDGGKVIVWGTQTAQAYGSIFARGGAQSGNGGFIETSGHHLDVAGIRVNAGASKGKNGQWLLDPENIIVNDGPASLIDVAAFDSRPGETTEISAQLLSNATADVILQATNDITFQYGVVNTHEGVSLTAQAGNNIYVDAMLSFTKNITLAANYFGTGEGRVLGDGITAINAGGVKTITDYLNPPVVVPPVTPPPSVDICTIAPNSALCQVLSPPTASEPVKPVQQASNEIIKTVNSSAPKTDFDQLAFLDTKKQGDSSSGGSGPSASSSTPDDKKSDDKKADTKEVASNDKSGTKNEPTKKMYCN